MSLSQQKFNESYQALCQQLGDLVFKRDRLQEDIDRIKALITGLNASVPLAQQVEQEVAQLLRKESNEQG